MDPNKTLALMLAFLERHSQEFNPEHEEMSAFAEHFENLHGWLKRGGALPELWAKARDTAATGTTKAAKPKCKGARELIADTLMCGVATVQPYQKGQWNISLWQTGDTAIYAVRKFGHAMPGNYSGRTWTRVPSKPATLCNSEVWVGQ